MMTKLSSGYSIFFFRDVRFFFSNSTYVCRFTIVQKLFEYFGPLSAAVSCVVPIGLNIYSTTVIINVICILWNRNVRALVTGHRVRIHVVMLERLNLSALSFPQVLNRNPTYCLTECGNDRICQNRAILSQIWVYLASYIWLLRVHTDTQRHCVTM